MAEGAYAANTLRAQQADGALFQAFCDQRGESFLPADPGTIRAFIEHEVAAGKKPATVRRYIATVGRAHVGAGLPLHVQANHRISRFISTIMEQISTIMEQI